MNQQSVVAISAFSGCGGLDVGSHMAGIPIVVALDSDKDCIATLRANKQFSNTAIWHRDIKDIPLADYLDALRPHKDKKLILVGGPPCQPFSKNGYWVTNAARKVSRDPKNMISDYLRLLKVLKPDGFLLENVESILHPTNKHMVSNIRRYLTRHKYFSLVINSNALDYGVAQKRKRVFILGSRYPFEDKYPQKTHCSPEYSEEFGLTPYVSCGSVIAKFRSKRFFEPWEVTDGGTYADDLYEVPPGQNYIALTARRNYPNPKFVAGARFWNFLLKLHPEMPSWTIPAQPGPWVGPFHWSSRRLRIPEIAAIQTFPESYKFIGSRRSIQRQIGNAVPPILGKAMIQHLIKFI